MIGALEGIVESKKSDAVLLWVSGVGYLVYIPSRHLQSLKSGQKNKLYIHTHVREDHIHLYGFSSKSELGLFELLLTISGIGPKTSLMIVDQGVAQVEKAVVSGDVAFFTSIPRLGKKNAHKILIELKSKLGNLGDVMLDSETGETLLVVDALVNMGFTPKEIKLALRKIPKDALTLNSRIKETLKLLGK